jgi:LmbE family N-acetylglucosaminyl deacetylase
MVVDITDHMERKTELLKCHASQESWLDDTQKMSSYVKTMWDLGEEMGRLTERFRYGEGWRKHLHLGFCDEQANPLQDELSPFEIAKG